MLAGFVEPMLSVTMAPTVISASEKINVLPAAARLQVDCRVPPGHGEETAIKRVREVLGDATATRSSSTRRSSATARAWTRR